MPESKYGKYIVTDVEKFKPDSPVAPDPGTTGVFLFTDDDVVKGSFFVRCTWFRQTPTKGRRLEAHTHDYDEVIAFLGTDPEDPHELGGEIELWLEDEKHIITKSCLVFVPKGMKHGPLQLKRIDRPVFHFTTGTAGKYGSRAYVT